MFILKGFFFFRRVQKTHFYAKFGRPIGRPLKMAEKMVYQMEGFPREFPVLPRLFEVFIINLSLI